MHKCLLTLVALFGSSAAGAAGGDTILSCAGVSTDYGIAAPKWEVFSGAADTAGDVIVIAADRSWATSVFYNTSVRLNLCKETSTKLLYSFDCSVDPNTYKSDWLRMTDPEAAHAAMTKKYGQNWTDHDTLSIDRINLTVLDEKLLPDETIDRKKVKPGQPFKASDILHFFFMRVSEYRGQCKVAKTKI